MRVVYNNDTPKQAALLLPYNKSGEESVKLLYQHMCSQIDDGIIAHSFLHFRA